MAMKRRARKRVERARGAMAARVAFTHTVHGSSPCEPTKLSGVSA